MTRAAGKPMAEPSAPITRTRLRNNPPNRNTTKKQRRSQTISSEILQARRANPRPIVTPMTPRIEPISGGGRVFLRDQIHKDHHD